MIVPPNKSMQMTKENLLSKNGETRHDCINMLFMHIIFFSCTFTSASFCVLMWPNGNKWTVSVKSRYCFGV